MKKPNLINQFKRWRLSQADLLAQVDALQRENIRLRQKLAALQLAKDQAETHAEDRRREKEALRSKVANQKRELDSRAIQIDDLGAKIAELRTELDTLRIKKQ